MISIFSYFHHFTGSDKLIFIIDVFDHLTGDSKMVIRLWITFGFLLCK
jgi:hypothetical protein